jgi:hypothetical protein
MATLITLLTDFGSADSYVGEVKGVLLSQVHGAALVDITHQVPPGDVRAAQYILSRVWYRFPQGSVHLAVVDPGVGTDRRVLAASTAGHYFVAPDNGLLSFLPADAPFVGCPSRQAPPLPSRRAMCSRPWRASWPLARRCHTWVILSPTRTAPPSPFPNTMVPRWSAK